MVPLDTLGTLELTCVAKETLAVRMVLVFLIGVVLGYRASHTTSLDLHLTIRLVHFLFHALDLLHHEIKALISYALWILDTGLEQDQDALFIMLNKTTGLVVVLLLVKLEFFLQCVQLLLIVFDFQCQTCLAKQISVIRMRF